jgi:hypothetical protein
MREHDARTETLRAGRPLAIGSVTLLPIERTLRHAERRTARPWFIVAKEPHALIVCDARGIRALGIAATQVSLDRLREEVPGLDAILASM